MKIEKLRKSAKWLHRAVWCFILLVAVAYGFARLGIDAGPTVEVHDRTGGLGSAARLVTDLSTLLFLGALMHLAGVLRHIAAGEMFGPAVTGSLRRFALWLFLSAIVSIAGPTLVDLFIVHPQGGAVRIVADLRDLFFLVTGLVLFLVARVLEAAAAVDAELREIV